MMDNLNITNAEQVTVTTYSGISFTNIHATIDGQLVIVPLDPANRHYAEIMRQVEAGELTIQDADS